MLIHSYWEKAMASHSSTLAWKIPWTEEPGRLQSMGSLGVRHDWATSLSLCTFMHWRRRWQPTPVFLPGESQGRGAWWAAFYGVAQSWIWLKRLSSSIYIYITYIKSWSSWTVACQTPLFMGFSRQEYWSGLPFPTPGDLSDPRIKPTSPASPELAGGFFATTPYGKPTSLLHTHFVFQKLSLFISFQIPVQ